MVVKSDPKHVLRIVIPAKAGIHGWGGANRPVSPPIAAWIPAFAGMTIRKMLLCRLNLTYSGIPQQFPSALRNPIPLAFRPLHVSSFCNIEVYSLDRTDPIHSR